MGGDIKKDNGTDLCGWYRCLCHFAVELLQLFQQAQRSLVDGVVLETYDTSVGAFLNHDTGSRCGPLEVATAKKVSYFIYIDAKLIGDALAAATGHFVLDAAQFIKGDYHSDISV